MNNTSNEIEQFIYKICFQPLWESVNTYISNHVYTLDLKYSRIKYPDRALLQDIILEHPTNIRINGDSLFFDAAVSCTIDLIQDNEYGYATHDIKQWLTVSCEAIITSKLDSINITGIEPYQTMFLSVLCPIQILFGWKAEHTYCLKCPSLLLQLLMVFHKPYYFFLPFIRPVLWFIIYFTLSPNP